MEVYNDLINNGYYLGNSKEIFTSSEIKKLQLNIESDIDYNFNSGIANDWSYTLCCDWPDKDQSKNKDISASEIPNKLKQIKEERAVITQSWYYKPYCNFKNLSISTEIIYSKLNTYVSKIYNINVNNITTYPNVTYYTKNDFIAVHQDGRAPNRICGILIYLNSPNSYQEDYGGRLLLQPADQYKEATEWDFHLLPIKVNPISYNMVVIDFTKHNIMHAVERCTTNFYRTALLAFCNLTT